MFGGNLVWFGLLWVIVLVGRHLRRATRQPAPALGTPSQRKTAQPLKPRTEEGKQAWDTFMTLADTAKKLGVSFYHYIYDRVSQANDIPKLADLIAERVKQLWLGAAWEAA
jgi:hypothetical protein